MPDTAPVTVPEILVGLADRRATGKLDLTCADRIIEVTLVDGLVTGIHDSRESLSVAIRRRRTEAGDAPQAPMAGQTDYARREAVARHAALDQLYALQSAVIRECAFRSGDLSGPGDPVLGCSAAELRTEFRALKGDGQQCARICPPGSHLILLDPAGLSLTGDERSIIAVLTEPTTVEEVRRRSMLSLFHFQEAVLALHERGAIGVLGAGDRCTSRPDTELEGRTASSPAEARCSVVRIDPVLPTAAAHPLVESGLGLELPRSGRRLAAMVINARLLEERLVPSIVAGVILAAGVLGPLVFWSLAP